MLLITAHILDWQAIGLVVHLTKLLSAVAAVALHTTGQTGWRGFTTVNQ